MKFLTAMFALLQLTVQAQRYATTDEGLRVQLNDNGTWVLLEKDTSTVITVNSKAFTKPSTAIAVKKSTENNLVLAYNPVIWKSSKVKSNEDAEFELDHVKGNAFAMVITEKIDIPLESLKKIFFENLLESAPDAKMNNAEYRTVNGLKVLHMEVSGTMEGIKFVYYGYFFSNEKGTTQLICYTAKTLLSDYKNDFEDLLNGLTIAEK